MTIYELECFISLAHHLNFTKAAACMNITQPAFSRHIFIIESELGVSLFFRNKRAVYLTKAGEIFLEEAKKIVDCYHQGAAKAIKAEKGLIGSIKIGILSEQFNNTLPEAVRRFSESYPSIDIEINEYSNSAMISALQDYKIDIGFTITPGISAIEDIIWERDMVFEQAVVLPLDHPFAERSSIDAAELKDEKFIFFEPDSFSSINDITLQICNKNNFNPNVVKTAPSVSGLMTFVECGKGICIVPYHFKKLYHHKVSFVKLSGQLCAVERIFAWRKSNTNPCLPFFIRKAVSKEENSVPGS